MLADDYLEDFAGRVCSTSGATSMSRFCNELIAAFVDSGAPVARVAEEKTAFDSDALYKGLWNASCKSDFKGSVRVHRQDGMLLLVRKETWDGKRRK